MVKDPWTIPLNGVTYACWKNGNTPSHRPLSRDEETEYFKSPNKEKFLYDLLND